MMARVLEHLPEWVNGDAALVRRGRYLSATFLVEVGDTAWLVTVHEGRVTRVERGPFLMRDWAFAVRASAEAWRRFWEPVPAPGFHDLLAMTKFGHARVDGDLRPFRAPRAYGRALRPRPRGGAGVAEYEPITGRYVRLDLGGRIHRVYFEEAGQGIPLVCLHTAGADGRQWRHLLNDAEV